MTNWINVPIRNPSITVRILDARVLDPEKACQSTIGKLSHYKSVAPFHKAVAQIVEKTFSECSADDSLVKLNANGLRTVCEYIGLPFRYKICSEMPLTFPDKMKPGDWAPEICRQIGAKSYLNPIGGRELFDEQQFRGLNVDLLFLETTAFHYSTGPYEFVPNLSILDVLMWNDPQKVKEAIMQHQRIVSTDDLR